MNNQFDTLANVVRSRLNKAFVKAEVNKQPVDICFGNVPGVIKIERWSGNILSMRFDAKTVENDVQKVYEQLDWRVGQVVHHANTDARSWDEIALSLDLI